MTRRIAAVLSAACIAALGSGTASWAGQGHDKPAVCHPTGKGWVVIKPAQASSHIDEATGAPKHEHSGRVDVYAVNGACPTIPTTTPEPTWSSPTSTPSTSTTSTAPSTASTTTQPSSPSPSSSSSPSTPKPSTATSKGTTATPQSVATSTLTRSLPSPSGSTTTGASPAPELAATGSSLDGAIAAAFLLTVGLLVLAFYRVLGRREGGRR